MGDFGPRFLEALAGQAGGGVPGSPTSPITAVPPETNPGMRMFGITPDMLTGPGGINEAGAVPDGNSSAAMEAIVQGFKPKKISFWGALGDQLLKHWGNQPAFGPAVQQKNLRRAMEGFTGDPMDAISRIAQIPGMEGKAWDLLNQYQDNQRASGTLERQNRALDLQNERIMYDRVAGMMNVASPDTWKKMREQAIRIGQARNVDVSHLIPEEYDPDSVEFIRYGTFKPKDYIAAQDRSRGLDIREADTESKIERRDAQTAQGERRLDQAQERLDKPPASKAAPAPKYETRDIKDSQGNIRRVIFDRKNGKAYSKLPNGKTVIYGIDGKQLKVLGVE